MKKEATIHYKRKILMIVIDSILLIFLILMQTRMLTGQLFHELIGVCLFFPVLLHLLLSWKWISKNTLRLFKDPVWRHRLNYLLNFTFFVLVVLDITSGIIISDSLFPGLKNSFSNKWHWRSLHNTLSDYIVVLTGVHMAMNWQRITGYLKNKGAIYKDSVLHWNISHLKTRLTRVLAIILLTLITWVTVYIWIQFYTSDDPSAKWFVFNNFNVLKGGLKFLFYCGLIYLISFVARRLLKIRL